MKLSDLNRRKITNVDDLSPRYRIDQKQIESIAEALAQPPSEETLNTIFGPNPEITANFEDKNK